MKRVFAFISLFAIALVMFGFGTSNVKAADQPAAGKWFENPYLLTDDEGNVVEIPMYIMNSIKTTFPDYFDYEGAKGTEFEDKNWGGTVRQYAWNGVKVIIPQFNAEGATGKYYGIYPQGAHKGGQIGIGGMIYTTSGTYEQGTFYKGGSYVRTAPADPSLSFYLFNDQEADWSMVEIIKAQVANPYIIFDGEGKAVAGLVLPDTSAGVVEAAYGLGQEFCYDENGVGVVANADASNCAKVMVDGEEDDLDKPILDEEGNPTGEYEKVQVPGDDPNYIAHRYVWQYMEEKPTNLNNGYLNEGWRADNWDFYNEETKVAVMLLGSYFANGGQVSAAELAADETIEAGHVRAPFNSPVIPAGGLLYKFGYLERTSTLLPLFKEVQAQAYLYGRDEAYSQTVKCYNYASSDISLIEGTHTEDYSDDNGNGKYDAGEPFTDINGNGQWDKDYAGYSLIEGTNTYEVVAGTDIDFDKLINITGISYSFADETDPTSFQSSVLSASQLSAKRKDFIEAEKALLREEVAYEAYQKWLDEQAAQEAKLIAAKTAAQAEYTATKAAKEALEAAAEAEILALTDDAAQPLVNGLKAAIKAIADQEKAIENYKKDIKAQEDKVAQLTKDYAAASVSHKDTLQYKGYNTSLSDAKAAHDAALAVVSSYIALGLGNTNITTADVVVKATQKVGKDCPAGEVPTEDWTIVFANATIEAAENAFIAAIGTADEATAREALVATFSVDATSEFKEEYTSAVNKYIDTLVNLNIANIAMRDYINECYEKIEALKAELATAIATLGVPFVDADKDGVEDLNERGTATGMYAILGNHTVLDDPSTKDDETLAASGMYKTLEDLEAAKIAYIATEYLNNSADYLAKVDAYNAAVTKLADATAALGYPTYYVDNNGDGDTKDAGETIPATGFYANYEAIVNQVEADITAEATVRAEVVYKKWLETEYRDEIALEYTVYDGENRVVAKSKWANHEELVKDLWADMEAWRKAQAEKNGKTYTELALPTTVDEIKSSGPYYATYNNHFGHGYDGTEGYMVYDEAFWAEWGWLFEYIALQSKNAGGSYLGDAGDRKVASPGNWSYVVLGFIVKATPISGWPASKVDWSGALATDGWQPVTYADYVLTASDKVNAVKTISVTVYNPIIKMTSSIEFEVVSIADEYDATPIIEVNKDALYVTDAKAFDLRSIAKAYDRVYSPELGLKGNDISSQINFVCPELDAALASGVISGEFPVQMTVVNAYGRKVVTESAVVKFVDTVAPVLNARDVTLNYGEDFHFLDGIYFAYDNVEGNLFEADYFAFVAEQDTVNTLKPGEYTVKVSAMDKSGNSREVEYVVVVNEQEVNVDEIIDAIEDVNSAVEDTQASLGDVKEDTEEIKDNQAGIAGDAADAKDAAENNSLVVVATVLAGVAALASVGAVVLVVLKRK